MSRRDSLSTSQVVILADPCKDNFFARTEAILDNFFSKISNAANIILDLPNEIKLISNILTGNAVKFVGSLVGSLSDKLVEFSQTGLKKIADEVATRLLGKPATEIINKTISEQEAVSGVIKSLFNGLKCVAAKAMNALGNVFNDLLTSAVKNVLNVPVSAVKEIIGKLNNKVVDTVDSLVSPLLEPLEKVFGFVFKIKHFLSSSINVMRKMQNLFTCPTDNICPASVKYVIDKGLDSERGEGEQQGLLNQAMQQGAASRGVSNLVGDFERQYGQWNIFGSPLSEASPLGPCYTGNIFECGVPKVTFFGGGGSGAAGKAILGNFVNNFDTEGVSESITKTASIIGVQIDDPGSGYSNPPFISFNDNCDKGYGAYGRAIIKDGKVSSVIMISNGENYPTEIEQQDDIFYIDDVIIENPGTDYSEDDNVEGLDLTITDGRITSIGIQNVAFNGYPDLNINSTTGYGAVLRPIMRIVPPQQKEIVQVIDCVR